MTRNELSLLLYCESRAVNHGGTLDAARLNNDEFEILRRWVDRGFIRYGRIKMADHAAVKASLWCELTDAAWQAAHAERRQRASRMWEKRRWKKTSE